MSYYAYAYYTYTRCYTYYIHHHQHHSVGTGNYCGKPHVYVGWGVSEGRGGQRYVSLGFASGLSTDRNIPWEIWLDLAKKDNNRSKPFGLQTRNALNL